MANLHTDRYSEMIINDSLYLFLGEKLGEGQYRDVYKFGIDPDLVVKIEARNHPKGYPMFCNTVEMGIWCESNGTPWRKWLAPCVFISNYGAVMIQRRTTPCPAHRLPKLVPNFLADLKPDNWGLYKGRPVVHDYGNHAVNQVAQKAFKLVPGQWHDGTGKKLKL
jgi:hypothetical protein